LLRDEEKRIVEKRALEGWVLVQRGRDEKLYFWCGDLYGWTEHANNPYIRVSAKPGSESLGPIGEGTWLKCKFFKSVRVELDPGTGTPMSAKPPSQTFVDAIRLYSDESIGVTPPPWIEVA
jgi:hypothetical protein